MAINPERPEPRSRRAILAGAIGGVAGLIGSRFVNPARTSAAAGGPVIMGAANSAGTTNTSLATASSGTGLLITQNGTGTALRGSAVGPGSIAGFFTANNGTGISGVTGNGGTYGVFAQNNGAHATAGALRANGGQNHGVVASTAQILSYAVLATHSDSGVAIQGDSTGDLTFGDGVKGTTSHESGSGVVGVALAGVGIGGQPASGVHGFSYTPLGYGVWGESNQADGDGVHGEGGNGVTGKSTRSDASGVYGENEDGFGVAGRALGDGTGVYGDSSFGVGTGVLGRNANELGLGVKSEGHALVTLNLTVTGAIFAGTKDFRIDHPLDPSQKFLSHSCVESDDRRTVYDGEVTLDAKGEATVVLPAWFGALNGQTRIQLTPIGAGAPELHVKSEVSNNRFAIGGGAKGQKVYWHLTGVRQDAYAKAHPLAVEAAKAGAERGRYLHPEVYGKAASKSIDALHASRAPKAAPTRASAPALRP